MKTKLEEMKREAKTWVKTYEHDNGHGDSEYYFSKTILTLIAIVERQHEVLEFYGQEKHYNDEFKLDRDDVWVMSERHSDECVQIEDGSKARSVIKDCKRMLK